MGEALYVKRDTTPSLHAGEAVMVFSRVKGSEAVPPRFYVVALDPGSSFEWQTVQGPRPDPSNYTPGLASMARGQRASVVMNTAVTDDDNVYVLRCLRGRIGVTLVSAHEARMQFRPRERKTA